MNHQPQPTRIDRFVVVLFWLNVAGFVFGFVIWKVTGHPPIGLFAPTFFAAAGALRFLWTRIP